MARGTTTPRPRNADRAAAKAALRGAGHKEPRTVRGQRTRRQIMEGGLRVFAREGFLKTRIQDISAEADVALGSIYVYFDDKADILAALLEDVFPDLLAGSRKDLPTDHVDTLCRGVQAYVVTYAQHVDLMRALTEAMVADERFAEYWYQTRGRVVLRLMKGFQAAAKAGQPIVDEDNTLLASALGGMINHFCATWIADRGERMDGVPFRALPDLDDVTRLLTRLILRALFLEDLPAGYPIPSPDWIAEAHAEELAKRRAAEDGSREEQEPRPKTKAAKRAS